MTIYSTFTNEIIQKIGNTNINKDNSTCSIPNSYKTCDTSLHSQFHFNMFTDIQSLDGK